MSGNIGWSGGNRTDDFTSDDDSPGFSHASRAYASPASSTAPPRDFPPPPSTPLLSRAFTDSAPQSPPVSVDLSVTKRQKTTAKNVVIIAIDISDSVGSWREELFDRLALFFTEAQKYLGESLEVMFIGFDDVPKGAGLEVTPLGAGRILDTFLLSMNKDGYGYGNGIESADLAAWHVHQLLDTSDAQNVFFFTITDEGFYDLIGGNHPRSRQLFSAACSIGRLPTKDIYDDLRRRMKVLTIFAKTPCESYSDEEKRRMLAQWEGAIGCENVLTLHDARRVVDVMLGAIAIMNGQGQRFSRALRSRQAGTQYTEENISTVEFSLSRLRVPKTPTRALSKK